MVKKAKKEKVFDLYEKKKNTGLDCSVIIGSLLISKILLIFAL